MDQAGRQATYVSDHGSAEGCGDGPDQQHFRQALLSLLAGFLGTIHRLKSLLKNRSLWSRLRIGTKALSGIKCINFWARDCSSNLRETWLSGVGVQPSVDRKL